MTRPAATARNATARRLPLCRVPSARNVGRPRYDFPRIFVPDGDSHLAARLSSHHLVRDWCNNMANGTCGVSGCGRVEQLRRGMCSMHYGRWMKYGTTDKPLPTCPKGHRVEGGQCAECTAARVVESCTIENCTDPQLAHGWCRKHYLRWYRLGSTDTPPRFVVKICSVDSCDQPTVKRGWCDTHHMRWKRTGTTDDPPPKPAECAVEGCDRAPAGLGWCKRHHALLTGQGVKHEAKRRALKLGSQIGPVDYDAILAEFGMVCHLCDAEIDSRDDLHFDHVIPLSRGGPHVQENIRPSHKKCNLSKNNKLMSELLSAGKEVMS